jgi:hypothetical protein
VTESRIKADVKRKKNQRWAPLHREEEERTAAVIGLPSHRPPSRPSSGQQPPAAPPSEPPQVSPLTLISVYCSSSCMQNVHCARSASQKIITRLLCAQ